MRHEQNAYNYLQAVVKHSLDVYAYQFDKYVCGEDHYRKTREEREGCHISHNGVADLSVSCENEYGQKVHRRGAELEGEGVPLVVPCCRYAVAAHGINKLLVELGYDHDAPSHKKHAAKRFIAAILEFPYHKSRNQNCERERNDVPRTEKRRFFHCCAKKIHCFFKEVHMPNLS